MANAVRLKMEQLEVHFDVGDQRIFSFIDCAIITSNRTGSGPARAGANALRYNNNIQRGFYTGYKKNTMVQLLNLLLVSACTALGLEEQRPQTLIDLNFTYQ
jgi:hypothetical protein